MESKQDVTKQPIDHWRSERSKKIPRDKWKWKYNDPKPMWHGKGSFKSQLYQTILEKYFNFVDRIPHHKEKMLQNYFTDLWYYSLYN